MLSVGIVQSLPGFVQNHFSFHMAYSNPFCIIQETILKVPDMLTCLIEEVLVIVRVRCIGSVGMVVFRHDSGDKISIAGFSRQYNPCFKWKAGKREAMVSKV